MWRPKPIGFTIDLLCFRKSCAPMTKKSKFYWLFFFFPCNNRFESYCCLNKYQQATQSETKLFYWVEVNNHQVVLFFSQKICCIHDKVVMPVLPSLPHTLWQNFISKCPLTLSLLWQLYSVTLWEVGWALHMISINYIYRSIMCILFKTKKIG